MHGSGGGGALVWRKIYGPESASHAQSNGFDGEDPFTKHEFNPVALKESVLAEQSEAHWIHALCEARIGRKNDAVAYSGTRVDVPRKHAHQVAFFLRKSHPEDHCKGTVTLVPL
jgi:hypothetical protein